jgi:hypothetical protein
LLKYDSTTQPENRCLQTYDTKKGRLIVQNLGGSTDGSECC